MEVVLVADAYDGRYMRQAIENLYAYSAGQNVEKVNLSNQTIMAGGDADFIIFVGHNGLMDFSIPNQFTPESTTQPAKSVAVFACMSQQYFSAQLKRSGAVPVILTTQFMAPEAYNVDAVVSGWMRQDKAEKIHERVVATYSKYQRLKAPSRRLFVTHFAD